MIGPLTASPPSAGDGSQDDRGDLVSEIGDEIRITFDRWSLGQLGVADLLAAVIVVAAGLVVGWIVRRAVRRSASRLVGGAATAVDTFGRLLAIGANLVAAAIALEILGFGLGPILVLVLIAIMAILLLRPMLTNLSSGLLLELRRVLEPGDLVEVADGEFGTVVEITTRTTALETPDGLRVHVPNSEVLDHAIVNYTTLGMRRTTIEVMVDANDADRAIGAVLDAIVGTNGVADEPSPTVWAARVVGPFVGLRVLIWHAPEQTAQWAAVDATIRAALSALQRVGITTTGPTVLDVSRGAGG